MLTVLFMLLNAKERVLCENPVDQDILNDDVLRSQPLLHTTVGIALSSKRYAAKYVKL